MLAACHSRQLVVRVLLTAILTLLSVGVLHAQDNQQKSPGYKVDVTRVYDFVSVRDKSGAFVKGLTKGDFVVRVNGVLVTVDAVEEVHNVKRSDAKWRQISTSGDIKGALEAGDLNIAPKHIVLVFDVFNSGPLSIKYAKRTAHRLLDELLPIDYVSVFEYNGTLRQLTTAEVPGPEEAREVIDKVIRSGRNPFYYFSLDQSRTNQFAKKELFRDFMRSMQRLANGLAHQTTIHRFLLFSEGMTLSDVAVDSANASELDRLANEAFDDLRQVSDSLGSSSSAIEQLETTPNFQNEISTGSARINTFEQYMSGTDAVFYTVRRGQLIPEYKTSINLDISAGGGKFGRNDGIGDNQTVAGLAGELEELREGQLREFANLTGGKYYSAGMNDERFVKEILNEVGNYYHVFFSVPSNLDREGFNTLEVSVGGKNYKVSHRRGFFGPSTREGLAKRRESFAKNELAPVRAQFKSYIIPKRDGMEVLYLVEVPTEDLNIRENGEAQVELRFSAGNKDKKSDEIVHELTANVSESSDKKLKFYSSATLLSTKGTVSLTMSEPESGRQVGVDRTISMNKAGESTLLLSEPMLFEASDTPPGMFVEHNEERIADNERAQNLLAGVTGSPLISRSVSKEQMVELVLLIGRNDADWSEADLPLQIDLILEKKDGSQATLRVAKELLDMPIEGELLRYHALVPLGYAPEGENKLLLLVSAKGGEETASSSIDFTVQ